MATVWVDDRRERSHGGPGRAGRLLRQASAGFGFWLLFVVVLEPGNLSRAAHAGMAINVASEALRMVSAGLLGAPVCPLALWLGRRFPVRGPGGLRNAAVLLAALTVLAVALILFAGLLAPWLPPSSVRGGLGDQIAGNLLLLMSALALLVGWTQLQRPPAPQESCGPSGAFLERIAAKGRGRTAVLDVQDIEWIEAQGNYVALHVGPTVHLVRQTMAAMQAQLNPSCFARIHRGCIVNLARVQDIRPLDGGDASLTLQSGSKVRLSRHYRSALRLRLPT